jgi:peptidyl-prolyl cis-trans isomerase C
MKKIISGTFMALIWITGMAHATDPAAKQPVASVNGSIITEGHLATEYARLMPRVVFHRGVDDAKKQALLKQALDNLIGKELKIQEARELGLKPDPTEVNRELERVISKYPSKKDFTEKLDASGYKMKDMIHELERRQLAEAAYQHQVVDQVHITEADARAYYEENRAMFVVPVQYRLRNILIRVPPLANSFEQETIKNRATTIAGKIQKGMPFEKAVSEYSEGPDKDTGGDMGFLHKGRLEGNIEEAVLALQPEEVAGPFRTLKGYYIFRLEGIRPERQSRFEEIRDSLIKDLTRKAVDARAVAWMAELKDKADIVIYKAFKEETSAENEKTL